jgi:general secretion pathway protein B
MSYILDALRRADAERDRGVVPSLHSHVMTPASAASRTASRSLISAPWALGLGIGLLALSGAVYWGLQERPGKPVAASPTVAVAVPAVPAVATVVAPVAPAPVTPAPVNPVPVTRASVAPVPVEAAPALPATNAQNARPRPKPVVTPPTATAAAAGNVNESRIMARSELPADVQRQLPALAMSGSVYSPQPRNRMVIVDGRLSFEGEQVAPGLVLERIEPKSVVMRYQTLRFTVPL